eukprot:3193340-Amphidinium_carterae.1
MATAEGLPDVTYSMLIDDHYNVTCALMGIMYHSDMPHCLNTPAHISLHWHESISVLYHTHISIIFASVQNMESCRPTLYQYLEAATSRSCTSSSCVTWRVMLASMDKSWERQRAESTQVEG